MRRNVVFGLCLLVFGLLSTEAQARKGISIGTSEHLETVAQLPRTEEYQLNEYEYLNLGILYERFEIASLPFWITKEPKIIGISTLHRDSYYDLDNESIQAIIDENNLPSTDELKHLGFMDKYLGWLVLLGILVLFFLYHQFFNNSKPNEIEEIEEKPEENQTTINQ